MWKMNEFSGGFNPVSLIFMTYINGWALVPSNKVCVRKLGGIKNQKNLVPNSLIKEVNHDCSEIISFYCKFALIGFDFFYLLWLLFSFLLPTPVPPPSLPFFFFFFFFSTVVLRTK